MRQENSSSRQEKHLSSSEPSGQSTLPSHSRVEEIQGGPPEPQLNSVLEQVGGSLHHVGIVEVDLDEGVLLGVVAVHRNTTDLGEY